MKLSTESKYQHCIKPASSLPFKVCLLTGARNAIKNCFAFWLNQFLIWFVLETKEAASSHPTLHTHTHAFNHKSPFLNLPHLSKRLVNQHLWILLQYLCLYLSKELSPFVSSDLFGPKERIKDSSHTDKKERVCVNKTNKRSQPAIFQK